MLKGRTSTSLILIGILALVVGIVAIAWPGATILALVILFAVYAFMDAGLQTARAFSSRTAGPVLGHLLLALVDLVAGVIALAWPAPTAFVLVLVVAAWALAGGVARVLRRLPGRGGRGYPRAVHCLRAGVGRLRRAAVRPARRRRAHPGPAIRAVTP